MAVTYVAHNTYNNATLTPSTTWDAHNGGSLANPCVLLLVWGFADTTSAVSSATFAGNSMTSLGSINTSGTGFYGTKLFALLGTSNIPTGSQTVAATCTGNAGNIHCDLAMFSFDGVDSSSMSSLQSSTTTNSNTNSSITTGAVTSATGSLVIGVGAYQQGRTITGVGSGVTKDVDDGTGAYASYPFLLLEKAGAASVTATATMSAGDPWFIYGASLTASTGGPITGSFSNTLAVCTEAGASSIIITGALS